ncbi:DHS-like NAD/FAD-binding domain-containing protein [Periconia macrospinosa]|uniref:DHS-like NAD/FAD-binding domain-containing protein n=1 Tax=Periconia macrospinosa TaxID=97972 RepID=A0A2V1DKP6_9PLEO|nr:DHS-like NAD/FAD-binding domain-containing protein [Periconia macrospinosa]
MLQISPPHLSFASQNEIDSFTNCLLASQRILCLVGAGLSAASGIPTFRGADGLWNTPWGTQHRAKDLASPYAFKTNPVEVLQLYSERRQQALSAYPNPAHYALAQLARAKPELLTICQNVDGLCERAGHPASQLHLIHGSLLNIRCSVCDYSKHDTSLEPFVPIVPDLPASQLPRCSTCAGLLRPGVVWYGERLPDTVTDAIEQWIDSGPADLIIVIGTSLSTFPAAEYIEDARGESTRLAVINTDRDEEPCNGMREGDWFFVGDAAVVVPDILKTAIQHFEK